MEARARDDGAEVTEAGRAASNGGSSNGVVRQSYTPLFRAQNEDRYLRQALIRDYEQRHGCNLVVVIDQITQESVTLFAELLHGVDHSKDLHLLLVSPGGDGGVAVRLARMAQAACRELVILVPELAHGIIWPLFYGQGSVVAASRTQGPL